ncbi:hypothetical protein [Corynebacterium cystitidis]|uniref:hypothetical protein n=1 Tax=Corynebacterium cystitidis TaxID=35757 RepID=UPI00211EC757|nr:hypothetical protein [Corynebacterium cystitidis]
MALALSTGDARALRDALLLIPGVCGLHPGRYGEIALLLPGQRVPGLRYSSRNGAVADPTGLEVHITIDVASGLNAFEISATVRSVTLELTDAAFVDVIVADACDSSSASSSASSPYESPVNP